MVRRRSRKKAPSIIDVAKAAGVSHQTVSRVLNDSENVLPETRKRVKEAIDRLGYRRNSMARALARQRSETIGIITTTSLDYGPMSILLEVELAARKAGYYTVVAPVEDYDDHSIDAVVDHFLSLTVDGIVFIAPIRDIASDLHQRPLPVPVVAVTSQELGAQAGVVPVFIDQEQGARLAMEHLYALGHRDIAHVAGEARFFEARKREATWRSFMSEHGLGVREPSVRGWEFQVGYDEGVRFLNEGLPTAVFCANDQTALGLYRALEDAGKKVPEDVSIVGFDDMPASRYFSPALTTVSQDFADLGRQVMMTLLAGIEKGTEGGFGPKSLESQLVVRKSTRPLD